jgi:hypothetical protein
MTIRLVFMLFGILFFSSCRTTIYSGHAGQSHITEIQLSEANFTVLGSFIGSASAKKTSWSIKDKTGVISGAKRDLLLSAEAAGVKLTGARALVNITTDIIETPARIACTMSAEIIEFHNK